MRYLIPGVALCAVAGGFYYLWSSRFSDEAQWATVKTATLKTYCVDCHNGAERAGGLTLDSPSVAATDLKGVGDNPELWEKVVRKLRARAMPPPDMPKPDDGTYETLIAHLEGSLDRVAAAKPDPGPAEVFRRLNRTEFRNAVRDLLAVEIDAASLLPTDDSSNGFDNVNVAGVSPTLLDRYLVAAQRISRLAVGRVAGSPVVHTVALPNDLTQDDWLEGRPFGTRGGAVLRHTFPADGTYQFDIRLQRNLFQGDVIDGAGSELVDLMVDGQLLQSFSFVRKPPGAAAQAAEGSASSPTAGVEVTDDAGLTYRVPVTAGQHEIAVVFQQLSTALTETERQPFKADFAGRSRAAIYSVSVAGPFETTGPGDTPSRRRVFVCQPSSVAEEAGCARTVVSTLARRAYRRPVTDADLDPLLAFYAQARDAGDDFETGIEMVLRALLASPGFLFRVESPAPEAMAGAPYRINDIDLASRLSFFLWSSIPDDELLEAAERGKLGEPGELERQVRRMLADPRSQMLIDSFADQWLFLRNLDSVARDPRLFPDFDDNLRQAFKRETQLLFESILREDRSLLDLLRADYTFVNERLAAHYGIAGVYGDHFRRMPLAEDSVRRGLLGHGSVLTVTSYPDRTSPVRRGDWVLHNILGIHMPPPPANVPPLAEDEGGVRKVLTMRERMAAHRSNPTCAACHQVMDPVGLVFENFDAIGRWRTQETQPGEPTGEWIDPTGGLPDGNTYDGVVALREGVLKHGDLFVTTATEKLLIYALGRGLDAPDAAAVRGIVRNAQEEDYRLSAIIMGIVDSTPFRMRRSL